LFRLIFPYTACFAAAAAPHFPRSHAATSPPPPTQVTDYVPRGAARGAARLAVAASTAVIYFGAMKLNLGGPGVGGTLRSLWT